MIDFSERGYNYALQITNSVGEDGFSNIAGRYVVKSCSRFISDINKAIDLQDNEKVVSNGFWYDTYAVEKVCSMIEKFPHIKGKWARERKTFDLSDWEIFILCNLFGFKKIKNGNRLNIRRFLEAYIEVPRKNGKTFFIASIGLYMFLEDGEFGAEIYCGATSEKQANEVFTPARLIIKRDNELREHYHVEVNSKSLIVPNKGSKFEPVIGDPGDGSSPSCGIADEFHEHKNHNLVETFITGMGSREQPLMLYITTAGSDTSGPCYDKRLDIIEILDENVVDETIFGLIYSIDECDSWNERQSLIKANPNLGVSINIDFLESQLEKAKRSAVKQVAYKTKHLNVWVGAKSAWINMDSVNSCIDKELSIENYKGKSCYIGVDLASKIDIASVAIYFPPSSGLKRAVFLKNYLPESVVNENSSYKVWENRNFLISTPGNVTDFEYIEKDLIELKLDYDVVELVYDPFQATQFASRMQKEGFNMVEYGATVKNFSEPMKELESLILKNDISFEDNPVLVWMFGNVVAKIDAKDNIFPNKERRKNKIDGVVALIIAIGRSMADRDEYNLDNFIYNPISA